MSATAKQEKTVCVLLPNKEQLDVTVGVKSTGRDVFNRVSEILGIKELYFFGLTVVKDNEHIFLDLEEKLTKYFPKEWKQDNTKGAQRRPLPLLLCLKVQYYVENGRLICERKARSLYFSDLRERVLRSECRQQEEVYFQLAAYALQADLEDRPPRPGHAPQSGHAPQPGHAPQGEGQEGKPYFQPKEYFPPWILSKRGVDYLLLHGPQVHGELRGMASRDAVLRFIREACRLEDVPVTFYRLQKDKREERGTALLGLTLRGMQVYQEVNNIRQLLFDFPWSNVGRLTFLGKKFEIQPDGLPSARKLVYYTGSPFRSRHLLLHLSSSHRLYLSLQPALTHLRQLEETEEKKRYRESYISDDLDLDPPASEGSPGLSRHSTSSPGLSRHSTCSPGLSRDSTGSLGLSRQSTGCPGLSRQSTGSSGIEADARHHSSMEMASMEEEEEAGPRRAEKSLISSAANHGSSHTSGVDTGSKDRPEEEWKEEETPVIVGGPGEVSVDDPEDMLRLAETVEGVSVDCPVMTSEALWRGNREAAVDSSDDLVTLRSKDALGQVKPRPPSCVDRHSQSLDDVRLFPPPAPLGTALLLDSSHSYTFGLADAQSDAKTPRSDAYYLPLQLHCPPKPSFYGRRSTNCLSLDLLGDEQLLEFIL